MAVHYTVPFSYGDRILRVIGTESPRFVAKDVCEILTIRNHRDTLAGLEDDEKGVEEIYTPAVRRKCLYSMNPAFTA